MHKYSNLSKRMLAMLLTVAMMLPLLASALAFGASAADPLSEKKKTDAAIVAGNYDLTEAEKNLLFSGYLVGETHTYVVPTAKDELISVDTASKTVTAESYEKTPGYLWTPAQAYIVVNNDVKETVNFTGNTATYTKEFDAFTVRVKYELKLNIDEETQKLLLNAPAYLKQGLANLEEILKDAGNLNTFELGHANDDFLGQLNTTGVTYSIGEMNATLSFSDTVFATDALYSEKAAATALIAQMDNNGGKLDLSVIIAEYEAAEYSAQYLIENAERISKCVIDTYNYFYALTAPLGALKNGYTLMGSLLSTPFATDNIRELHRLLGVYNSSIDTIVADLKPLTSADLWKIAENKLFKDGLTASDYSALEVMAIALNGAELLGPNAVVTNPLVADTVDLQFNMSMYDVVVKVVLNVVKNELGSTDLVEFDTVTEVVTLPQNATKADILAAIADRDIVDTAISGWSAYVDGKFNATESELPAVLTEDITYTVTYSPNTYNVSLDYADDMTVPYGYRLLLPNAIDGDRAYDYYVDGAYYAQGSEYTVTDNVNVTRSLGKAYTKYTVAQIAANNYFATNAKASAILNSGALTLGKDAVNVRVPDNNNKIVTLVGSTLTAQKYASSYKGLDWVPYTYTVVDGTKSYVHSFDGATVVNITEPAYDRVDVLYQLVLTDISKEDVVLPLVNLPATLVDEANGQLSVLDRLVANASSMAELKKGIFNGAIGVIDGEEAISPEIKASMKTAIQGIIANCFDGDYMYIYNFAEAYKTGGLRYYYTNSAKLLEQVELVSGYLNDLLDTEEEKEALALVLAGVGKAEFAEKLDSLGTTMADIKEDLVAPNAAIDLKSASLSKLIEALETEGDVPAFVAVDYLTINAPSLISITADNKSTISASVQLGNTILNIDSVTFTNGHTFTKGEIDAIVAAINAKVAELNVNAKYYNNNYDTSALYALVDTKVAEDVHFAFTWTPKEFTVKIEGADDVVITVIDRDINLPASDDPTKFRYDYVINGVTVGAGVYTLSVDVMDKIFASSDTYLIKREVVDVARENYTKFVNELNDAIGSDLIVFALTYGDNGYELIMKLDTTEPTALAGAVKALATKLASYSYVAFEDEAFIYSDDNGSHISFQALIDTVMMSGFSTDRLVNIMDANGKIKDMGLPGEVLSDKAMTVAGGMLFESVFLLGDSKDAITYELPVYLTIGNAPDYLVEIRNLLADQLAPYFELVCNDGQATLNLTMPQKAYEAYLAVLLATDNVDITDINAINEDIAVGFLKDVIRPLMLSDASAESVENTLAKFGYNIELSKFGKAFDAIRAFYKQSDFIYDVDNATYDASLNISIAQYLDKLDLGKLSNLIVEKETGIDVCLGVDLLNLDKDYEALYFDIAAEGITNKFGLVTDVASKLNTMAGTAIVILLSDVDADLTFNTTTVLNLNGFTVNGNVTGKGSVRIVDSVENVAVDGGVTGKISGNVLVAGGKYLNDVSAFLPEGYEQRADGTVANKFINIVREENGDITVKLDAGALKTNKIPDVKTIAVDMIVELLLNGFTANKLYIDGYKIFELTVDDLVGLYAATDRKEAVMQKVMNMFDRQDVVDLANDIIADILDFDYLKEVLDSDIANGTESPLFSYELTTGSWGFSVTYVEDEDYISADITSEHEKIRDLNVVLTGEKNEKQHVANIIGILADTTDMNVTVDAVLSQDGKNFVVDFGVYADAIFDFSHDMKYAVMFSVILADGITGATREALVEGLRVYFETGETIALVNAFNKVKVSDFVTAVENFHRTDSFAAMLNNLGLNGYDTEAAKIVADELDAYAKVLGIVARRLDLTGPTVAMSNFLRADTFAYTLDKENIMKSFNVSLVAGYGITVNLTAKELFIAIKLFNDPGALDFSDLEALIKEVEKLSEENYTEDSWKAFVKALADARDALVNSTTQKQIDEAYRALKNATDHLENKPATPVNYGELNAQLKIADSLDRADYTTASWENFLPVLEAARAALNSDDQDVVDKAAEALEAAIKALVRMPGTVDLLDLILEAEKLNEEDYTPLSWANFVKALKDAKNALNSESQAEVDAAYDALVAAMRALENKLPDVPKVNYGELEAQIAIADHLDPADFTSASWEAFLPVLEAAKAALNSDDQDVVDKAAADLKAAIAALLKMPEVADLLELIAKAEELNEEDYTIETWRRLERALKAAKAAVTSESQAEVDEAYNNLKSAMDKLVNKSDVPGINYGELNAQINIAEHLTKEDYTSATWAALEEALAAAKNALTSNDQTVVDKATAALKAAIAALVEMPDTDALAVLIAKAEALAAANYTTSSWNVLKDALAAAKAALSSEEQAVVDKAADALADAIAKLVVKPSYEALKAEIAKADALDAADYTIVSWTKLQTALAAAKAALSSESQAAIDEATAKLAAAIAALELKPTEPEVDKSVAEALLEQIAQRELNADDYTPESWAAYVDALNDLNKALEGNSQFAINAAIANLKAALAGLTGKPTTPEPVISYKELNAAIADAEALDETDYTADSWDALKIALNAAKAALSSEDQAEVDRAAAALKAAIAGLEKKQPEPPAPIVVDYEALKAEIAKAEALKSDEYTAQSWAALQIALNAAKNALDSSDQAEVDKAVANLKAAIATLDKKGPVTVAIDYSDLKAEIAKAEALKQAGYTADSWEAFQTALTAAKAALNSDDQAVVNKATADLSAAIRALEVKGSLAWLWIVIPVAVVAVAGAVVAVVLVSKNSTAKKEKDDTPGQTFEDEDDDI